MQLTISEGVYGTIVKSEKEFEDKAREVKLLLPNSVEQALSSFIDILATLALVNLGLMPVKSAENNETNEKAEERKEHQVDFGQARLAIDTITLLKDKLKESVKPTELEAVEALLSNLQIAYARKISISGEAHHKEEQ